MKRIIAFLLCLVLVCLPASSLAHSGRTDSGGGHWNHSTGEYHYHHGHPAHQHTFGVCPYSSEKSSDSTNTYTDSKYSKDEWEGIPAPTHEETRFHVGSPLEKTYYEGYDDGYLTGYKLAQETAYADGWKAATPLVPAWCFVVIGFLVLVIALLIYKLKKANTPKNNTPLQ